MFDIFATIAKVLVGLGRFVISCRKTKRDRFEELEFEMESVLYTRWGHEIYPKDVRQWFASLPEKYNKPKYEVLKVHVYNKMKAEGRLKHKFHLDNRQRKQSSSTYPRN